MPTKNYYWDGVHSALNIERTPGVEHYLIHPNRLIYELAGYWIYTVAHHAGLHVRAIDVWQIVNGVLGALAAVVVYAVLTSRSHSLYVSCALSFLFAFSATWWKFSTDADSYIPSVSLMLVAFYLVIHPKKARPFGVAVAHAAGMMFHALAVFLFPALLLGLSLQTASSTVAERSWVLFQYTATAVSLTLSAYWFGFVASAGQFKVRADPRWASSPILTTCFSSKPEA